MASVKELKARLRGVETIQKITKAMKMVAASRLRVVQRAVKQVLLGIKFFPSFFQGRILENEKQHLILSITSERGLCGSINSAVNKCTLYYVSELQHKNINTDVFLIGSKGKDYLLRNCPTNLVRQVDQMGTRSISFATASMTIEELIFLKFDQMTVFFNLFESVASQKIYGFHVANFSLAFKDIPSPFVYESDEISENFYDMMGDLYQFSWTFLLFYFLIQNRTSEQASRVNAMESASKNAGEIIQTLRVFYNKARQGSITKELIEIISCANALSSVNRRVI